MPPGASSDDGIAGLAALQLDWIEFWQDFYSPLLGIDSRVTPGRSPTRCSIGSCIARSGSNSKEDRCEHRPENPPEVDRKPNTSSF